MFQWRAEGKALMKRVMAAVVCCSAMCSAQQANNLPDNYKTILANKVVRVLRVHYGAYEKVPVHLHPEIPTVYVYLNNSGQVKLTHYADGKVTEVVMRPPTHTGAYRVNAGKIETHSVENMGDVPSDFLRVEMPDFKMEPNLEFRGKAPEDLSHSFSAVEFSIPRLTITRVVCVGAQACPVQRPSADAVVVAFSDAALNSDGKTTAMKLGDVLSVPARGNISLSGNGNDPAHVLVISVGDSQ